MSRDSLDERPLLDSDSSLGEKPSPQIVRRVIDARLFFASFAFNLLLCLCVTILWAKNSTSIQWRGERPLYTPVQNLVSHEYKVFTSLVGKTEYHGPPTKEVDAAWDDLFELGISVLPKSEAARLPNRTEAYFQAPESFIVSLDVFHQLHCLNTIRKSLWPEHYPNEDRYQQFNGETIDHVDHCLNAIRESLMCNADTSVNVWRWDEKLQRSDPRFDNVHTCRRFDDIHEWAKQRRSYMPFNKTLHVVVDDLTFPDDI